MYSSKNFGKWCLPTPYRRRMLVLQADHRAWTLLIWTPVSGFTKCWALFTVSCSYPASFRLSYTARSSLHIRLPASTWRLMRGISVAASRFVISSMENWPVIKSTAPNTHCHWSWLFPCLALTTMISSMATMCPEPPSRTGLFTSRSQEHRSLINVN